MREIIGTPTMFLLGILVLGLLATLFRSDREGPTVVYVPVETYQQPRGMGCLPLLLVGGLLLVLAIAS